jgi:membrane protein DedA with SNARE-associated domain
VESGSWERVLELASQYGYAFLFLMSVAENTFLLGLVVPGDVAVVLGGALAAGGRLDPMAVTLVVIVGVLVGANLSFWIGRRGGIPLIERSAVRFAVDPRRIEKVELYFARHGPKTVFLAAFISGLKNLVPAVAGASKMSAVRFFAYNAAGSTVRSVLLVGVGFLFGASFPRAIRVIGELNVWIVAVLVSFLVLRLFVGWLRGRQGRRTSGGKAQDRVDRGSP